MASSTTDRRLGLTGGTAFKAPVDCATTANITLSGEQSIDGVTTSGSRVLVKNQTTVSENGIYNSDSGSWIRALDFDGANDVVKGTLVLVASGSTNAGSVYEVSASNPITIGTTSITFANVAALSSAFFTQSGAAAVSQDFQTKIRQYPDTPEDTGAAGDGTTSDQTKLQSWITDIATSAGGTDPGYALQLTDGKKYKLTDVLTIGNRRIAFRGNAGGIGSGAASIYQSVLNKDFFDFTTGNSDVASFENFMLLGQATGTGRGLILGSTAQSWFDSRVTNMWLASIGGKCIDGVNVQGGHITNTGFDSGATDAVYVTKGSDNVLALNRVFGMSSSGITFIEGDENTVVVNHFDNCGATNDTTAAIILDANTAGGKRVRGTLIGANQFHANINDVVLDGNSGVITSNTGCDSTLIAGNISHAATRRFMLATDSHQIAVVGNYVSSCNQAGTTYDAFEFTGTSDSTYFSGNKVAATRTDTFRHNYALNIGASVTGFVLGENDLQTGTLGKIKVASGGHVRALPGAPEYERFMCKLFDDFHGAEINANRWQSIVGTDPSCRHATIASAVTSGAMTMTTGADTGASYALNGVQIVSALNWKTGSGSFVFECKVKISAITNVAVFVGLTDQTSALEMPFTLAAGDALTSNCTDGFGVLFDTAADNDNWWLVGVANDVDATAQNTAVAPVADTYETWRFELLSNTSPGVAVKFYRNHTLIGAQMNTPARTTIALTPVIAAFSRTTSTRDVTSDYILVESERA